MPQKKTNTAQNDSSYKRFFAKLLETIGNLFSFSYWWGTTPKPSPLLLKDTMGEVPATSPKTQRKQHAREAQASTSPNRISSPKIRQKKQMRAVAPPIASSPKTRPKESGKKPWFLEYNTSYNLDQADVISATESMIANNKIPLKEFLGHMVTCQYESYEHSPASGYSDNDIIIRKLIFASSPKSSETKFVECEHEGKPFYTDANGYLYIQSGKQYQQVDSDYKAISYDVNEAVKIQDQIKQYGELAKLSKLPVLISVTGNEHNVLVAIVPDEEAPRGANVVYINSIEGNDLGIKYAELCANTLNSGSYTNASYNCQYDNCCGLSVAMNATKIFKSCWENKNKKTLNVDNYRNILRSNYLTEVKQNHNSPGEMYKTLANHSMAATLHCQNSASNGEPRAFKRANGYRTEEFLRHHDTPPRKEWCRENTREVELLHLLDITMPAKLAAERALVKRNKQYPDHWVKFHNVTSREHYRGH
jgi:hypothetical protein